MYKGSRHYCYQNSRFITAHKGKISWTLPPYLSLALLGERQKVGGHDQQIPSLLGKLTGRIQREPLNLVATIIFFGAIVHTFLAARFRKIAHNYQQSYEAIEYLLHATDGPPDFGKKHDKLLFRAQLFYFMGEVEAVFGIWLIPLFVAIIAFHGWSTMVDPSVSKKSEFE